MSAGIAANLLRDSVCVRRRSVESIFRIEGSPGLCAPGRAPVSLDEGSTGARLYRRFLSALGPRLVQRVAATMGARRFGLGSQFVVGGIATAWVDPRDGASA